MFDDDDEESYYDDENNYVYNNYVCEDCGYRWLADDYAIIVPYAAVKTSSRMNSCNPWKQYHFPNHLQEKEVDGSWIQQKLPNP
jgi:uncharacterized protein (DUF2225 family)